jgi:RHS repeat-associated protein
VAYLHGDQLGSTRLLTNSSGAVTATYSYDAYGNTTAHTGTASTSLEYQGQYLDPESGLYYLRARYLDPMSGQFISRDPVEGPSQRAYTYVRDNPMNSGDPSGLWLGASWLPSPGEAAGTVIHVVASGAGTLIRYSPEGQALQLASDVTGATLGGCVGGSFPAGGSVSGSVCYLATPSGQSGITVTAGGGTGGPFNASGYIGPVVSNGQTLNEQGGSFQFGGASAGYGLWSAGACGAIGKNSRGETIWDASIGWTPSLRGLGPPVSVHGGVSNTWTFPSWP